MPEMLRRRASAWLLAFVAIAAVACEEQQSPPAPETRAIKYMTLEKRAAAQQRRISAVVAAATTSVIAFQNPGQVVELTKTVGDRTSEGDVLARLDPEPLQLALDRALSELEKARAAVADAESKFQQQEQLLAKGFTTRTAFQSALAELRTARGQLGVAQSQVSLARRDLAKATLRAPFDGVVARKDVEQFEQVVSGEPIYVLQTENDIDVKVSLPETLIGYVKLGDPVAVAVSVVSDEQLLGRIAEIAPLAEEVNAYPVSIQLENPPPTLRPGMSAEAIFEFTLASVADAFTIPITALRPEVGEEGGTLFVFEAGQISTRRVRVVNVRDNALQVVGDVEAGDVIATAGVSLLYDGMQVRLFDPGALR